MDRPRSRLALTLPVSALAAALSAIAPPWLATPPTLAGQTTAETRQLDTLAFKDLSYRMVGPYRGGRSTAATGFLDDADRWLMGTTGGGVWESDDNGVTWRNISDGYFGGSIGAVAVAGSDPNVIYVGEGSMDIRGNTSAGRGAWKSRDAGRTWSFIGLPEAGQIGRIEVHPRDHDLVYVAALGHPVREEPGTRHLPLAGRRGDVGACVGAERLDRGVRSGLGHDQSAHSVCGDVAGGTQAVGAHLRAPRKAASTRPPTAATAGRSWAGVCRKGSWGRWA